MFGVVWMALVSGDQMRAFARILGFNDMAFGILAAMPFLATFGQLNAAVIVERTGLRKFLFLDSAAYSRLLWIPVALVPLLLPFPPVLAVTAVLILLAGSNFLAALSAPAWMTWMGDLIPRRIRGRYFARRAQITQVVQIVVVVGASLLLDWVTVPGSSETYQGQPMLLWTICAMFAVAGVFGTIDILLFRRIRELVPPPRQEAVSGGVIIDIPRPARRTPVSLVAYAGRYLAAMIRELLLEPLRDRVFRNYVFYGGTITFTATCAGWYFWRHATEALGFTKLGTNMLFMVIGPVAGTLTAGWWGRMMDRWGRRPVLILGTIGTVLSLVPWIFTWRGIGSPRFVIDAVNGLAGAIGALLGRPGAVWLASDSPVGSYLLAALGCVFGGSSWTGVGLAQTGIVMGFSDGQGRSRYVAASSVLISVGGVLGGLIGGMVAQSFESLQANPIALGPIRWTNWHVTFLLALGIRLASLAWLVRMPDPGAQPVRYLLRFWGLNAYNTVMSRLFYSVRLFGWGRSAREDNDRERPLDH